MHGNARDKPVLLKSGLSVAYHWLISGLSLAYLLFQMLSVPDQTL